MEDTQNPIGSDVVAALWQQKWIVLFFSTVALCLSILYLRNISPVYSVTLKVTSVVPTQSRVGARLGGVAMLAGINLPTDADAVAFDLYLEGLKGRAAANALAGNAALMRGLFAGEWDAASGEWRPPPDSLRPAKDLVKGILAMDLSEYQPPNGARVQEFINERVTVLRSPLNPVVSISVQSRDREWGRQFLVALHQIVDERLRQRSLQRTERYITYLRQRLVGVTVDDYRAALISTVSEQEKQRMVASSGLPYAAEPLEPPEASSRPTFPNPFQIVFLGLLLGASIGGLLAVRWDRSRAARWFAFRRPVSQPR